MIAYLKAIRLCLLISLAVPGNVAKGRIARDLDDFKPNEVVEEFSKHMKHLANDANDYNALTEDVQSWIQEAEDLKSLNLVTGLAAKLGKHLITKIKAVESIAVAVSRALEENRQPRQPYHRCCDLPEELEIKYDPRYKESVTDAVMCKMLAPHHLPQKEVDFSSVKTAFDTNKLHTKWQYFGSKDGAMYSFPSCRVPKCGTFDPRIRPWYVTTATPSPKNIVIMVDSSTSIGYNKTLDDAMKTAKLVVSTLNPQDKVSLILFNSTTFLPADKDVDECYNTTMAFASTFTINYLKSFINSAQPRGGTRFVRAFAKAFQILKNTIKSSSEAIKKRPSMFLLITDGVTRSKSIQKNTLKAIKKEYKDFKQEVKLITSLKVLTLLLGGKVQKKGSFLKVLMNEMGGKLMTTDGTKDSFSKLKGYFDYLMEVTPARQSLAVLSPPYVDAWGLGYMVTAASAYFYDNALAGVAGVDIPMTDLFADVQYCNQAGPNTYAFLVAIKSGHVMSHPKLPKPESISEDQNSVNIFELEPGKEFRRLFDEVKETGEPREKEFPRRLSTSRGGVLGDGVQTEIISYSYACAPVELGTDRGKEYMVCVALAKGDTGEKYASRLITNSMSANPIAYHRMDVRAETTTCYHTDSLSYPDRSVVKFSAMAFIDPANYIEVAENATAVREYVRELRSFLYLHKAGDKFDVNKIMTAVLTSRADEAWLSRENQDKYLRKFVRRYIGTYNGVLRLFPGAPLPPNFDHTTRSWYLRAVANRPDFISFAAPYLDPLGAGFIVSISQSIRTSYGRKNLFGVVGGDLTVSNFGAHFKKKVGKKCLDSKGSLRCFLLDSSGYVVYHPTFEDVGDNPNKVLNRHITIMHAGIARNLIKNGKMVKKECQNFILLKLQRFYEIKIENGLYIGTVGKKSHCRSYAIIEVPETNVFVVVTKSSTCLINRDACTCGYMCRHHESTDCECPCKARLTYNICNASLTKESNIPLCTQPSPSVPKRGPLKVNSADLGRCISVHCERYDEKECNEIFGCFWCNREADGSLLKEPKCMSDLQCYDGVMDQENPFLLPEVPRRRIHGGRKLNKMLLIIIGSSAGGLLIIILIVVVCCLHRKKFQYEQEQMEFQAMDMLIDPTTVIDANEGFNQMSLNYPGQSKAMQSTMALNYPGKSTVRQSKMTLNYPGKGAGRQSKMTLNYPGQSTVQAPMQLNYPGQSTVQAPMQLNYPGQSTVQAPMQLNNPGQSTAKAPMQLNYPGQSTVMPSNMQMRLGGQGMGYSTQAMSGMWPKRYGQSRIMSLDPKLSAMQTPQAPGGQRGRPTAGRRRPGPNRHVSFTDDVQRQEIQKPAPISGDEPIVTDENGDSED